MKAALISDTHGLLPDVSKFEGADFVLHAGDIGPDTWHGSRSVLPWYDDVFFEWARKLKIPIYATWGNHDFIGERLPLERFAFPENLKILVDQATEIEGKLVHFSPWSNLFGNWSWMRTEAGLKDRYDSIDPLTNVIVSHGPPKGYGDKIFWDDEWQHVGSVELGKKMTRLPKLELVVCGHIHMARGSYKFGNLPILVENASVVDEAYRLVYDPVIIDW